MAIIVNMACGLANRMFQYAYYRKLLKDGFDAKVDFFTTHDLAHENVDWTRIFPDAHYRQADTLDILLMGGGKDIVSKVLRKYFPFATKVTEMPTAYSIYAPKFKSESRYLLGVFQCASIADAIRDELLLAFKFPCFSKGINMVRAEKLAQENSVAIHVRKGSDYSSRIWYQNTCHIDYYKKAVEYISNNVEKPKFYVFTDNPQWVVDNFHWLDYEMFDGNPIFGWGSHFDMQLMSLCKHNIISNSTYSWWGAFLNNNPDKIVILPHVWFNPKAASEFDSKPLKCDNWIAL